MSEFSGILNQFPQKLYSSTAKIQVQNLMASTKIALRSNNTALTTRTATFGNTTANQFKDTMSTIYSELTDLKLDTMTTLFMILLFALFLYIFTKKCHNYYRSVFYIIISFCSFFVFY